MTELSPTALGELDIGHTPAAGGLSSRGTRYELRLRLSAQIRLFRPDLVTSPNPLNMDCPPTWWP